MTGLTGGHHIAVPGPDCTNQSMNLSRDTYTRYVPNCQPLCIRAKACDFIFIKLAIIDYDFY